MLEVRRLSPLACAAAVLALAACGSTEGADGGSEAADAAAEPEASMAAAPPAAASACFLRGAPEEVAERPSPLGVVEVALGDQTATFCYGRPSARGRTIMGELVPFGEPWRMGANEATALHLPFAADIGGIAVEPGSYSIYGIPGESEWEIVVNGESERWGVPINEGVTAHDLGSFSRPSATTDGMVETLTYTWMPHGEGMGHLVMEWENTRVEIPIHRSGTM